MAISAFYMSKWHEKSTFFSFSLQIYNKLLTWKNFFTTCLDFLVFQSWF
jgi:hypothetical protein